MISRKTIILVGLALGVTVVAVIGVWGGFVDGSSGGNVPDIPGKITVHRSPISDVIGIVSYTVGMTAVPGMGTYLLTRRDFSGWGTALATAACVILVGVGSWFGFVFPFFAFLVAAAAYLVIRRLFRAGPALVVSAATLVGGLACSVLAMIVALDNM